MGTTPSPDHEFPASARQKIIRGAPPPLPCLDERPNFCILGGRRKKSCRRLLALSKDPPPPPRGLGLGFQNSPDFLCAPLLYLREGTGRTLPGSASSSSQKKDSRKERDKTTRSQQMHKKERTCSGAFLFRVFLLAIYTGKGPFSRSTPCCVRTYAHGRPIIIIFTTSGPQKGQSSKAVLCAALSYFIFWRNCLQEKRQKDFLRSFFKEELEGSKGQQIFFAVSTFGR